MRIYKFFILIFFFFLNYSFRILERKKAERDIDSNPYYSKDLKEKLLFMRHGQTDFNADKHIIARRTNIKYIDCQINSKGIKQAISRQAILNTLSFEKVYVSPFYRTLQTLTYALSDHPFRENIVAVVHPLVAEGANCINDYILDIKQNKKDFNLNSSVKVDWSLFDEYIKGIKYDENFFYFDNFDCFNEKEKQKIYLRLKELYDKGNMNKFKIGLSDLAKRRFESKIRFESLKHLQGRFKKFNEFIRENHKETLENKDKKIFVVSHGSYMTSGTDMTPYQSEKIQRFYSTCYSPRNYQILSYKLLNKLYTI